MKALSLFAGVGGFDLAAERAGMTVVAHCEIDKQARAVLERRFPNALTYDDVRTLDPDELRRAGAVPDGWTEGQADSSRYRQMGNAVAVPCVEWILRRLVVADTKAVAA